MKMDDHLLSGRFSTHTYIHIHFQMLVETHVRKHQFVLGGELFWKHVRQTNARTKLEKVLESNILLESVNSEEGYR